MANVHAAREILDRAFAEVAALDGGMAGNWTVAFECFFSDGEPCLAHVSSEASTLWNRLGMMEAALTDERATWQSQPPTPGNGEI